MKLFSKSCGMYIDVDCIEWWSPPICALVETGYRLAPAPFTRKKKFRKYGSTKAAKLDIKNRSSRKKHQSNKTGWTRSVDTGTVRLGRRRWRLTRGAARRTWRAAAPGCPPVTSALRPLTSATPPPRSAAPGRCPNPTNLATGQQTSGTGLSSR